MKSPSELTTKFRAAGLKITPQRALMFKLLHGNTSHPSADAIYEEAQRVMPSISLRTVYQTLNDLVAMGEIDQIDLGTGATRFDPKTEGHHHFICDECSSIHDVQVDTAAAISVEDSVHRVRTAEVVFRGMCASCARKGSN